MVNFDTSESKTHATWIKYMSLSAHTTGNEMQYRKSLVLQIQPNASDCVLLSGFFGSNSSSEDYFMGIHFYV